MAPTGIVSILDGNTNIANLNLDSNGNTGFTTAGLSVGTHNLTASYPGDASHAPSVSSVLVEVINPNQQPTTTTLTSSANPQQSGQPITFIVNVS